MRFAAPEWFILLPVLAFAVWYWPALRRPLRVVCFVVLLLLLVQPEFRRTGHGLDLWVLADRSASASTSIEPHLAEWEKILERSKGADDRIFYVDYAAEAALRDPTADVELTGGREGTRTALAAGFALSQLRPNRAARLLALTDGYSTEPLGDLAEQLTRQQVALDYRLATEGSVRDFAVQSLTAPARAQVGEPFLVEFRVAGPDDEAVPYELLRDGKSLNKGKAVLRDGHVVVRFADRVVVPGGHRYTVRISPEQDAHPGNNVAERWVEISGGPRVLLVSGYQNDPLATVLRAQGFEVEVCTDSTTLNSGHLAGAKAVILNNVPAFRIPRDFLQALDFYVRNQGGGLLMTGGKSSFAAGAYFGSPVADLLPVSMEMRREERKIGVALAIVMDRSGSMGMPVGGGLCKIDLADAGAARAVELLGPHDAVTVFAVDTVPHEVVPLSVVGDDAPKLGTTIRRITSGGGGIYVYTGLNAAYEALKKSPSGVRHVILFADANDAEEPATYKELEARMVQEGMTVSAIGLGTEADKDAAFLTDVAKRGNGRVFFTAEPGELPSVFEQETVAIARAAFIKDVTPLKPLAGWSELAARPLRWLDGVDGFNLSYLRPGATAAAITADDSSAPLVAFWQRGTGRVAAVSFPLGGEFSARVRAWPEMGDFVQTLTRWLMGEPVPPGIGIRANVQGTELSADLFYDESWENTLSTNAPRLIVTGSDGVAASAHEITWERLEPGRYRATASLEPGQVIRGAVQIGKTVLPFGPLQAGLGAEWAFDPARPAELIATSRASGGVERIDLSTIWKAPRKAEFSGIERELIVAFLGLFLTELLLTRVGWKVPAFGAWHLPVVKRSSQSARKRSPVQPAKEPQFNANASPASNAPAKPHPESPAAAASDSKEAARRQRFKRAKQGK